jgi:hypothetical protein
MLRAGVGERALIFCRQRGAPGCTVALDCLSRAPARRMRALLVIVRTPVLVSHARKRSRSRVCREGAHVARRSRRTSVDILQTTWRTWLYRRIGSFVSGPGAQNARPPRCRP